MKLLAVADARYASADAGADILCTVTFDAYEIPLPHFRVRQLGSGDANEDAVRTALKGVTIAAYSAPAPTKAALAAYALAAWRKVLAKGELFNVAPSGSPAVTVLCDGTNETRADLAMLALFGQANPSGSKTWIDNAGNSTVLTGSELVALATAAGNWIANTYPALATLQGDIASGEITTTAAIDAYVWPTS